jgi:hypothetical protein
MIDRRILLLFLGVLFWIVAAGSFEPVRAQAPLRIPPIDGDPLSAGATVNPMTTTATPVEVGQIGQIGAFSDPSSWSWQLMPSGLMYRSYLAGLHEPRLGSQLVYLSGHGWVWDATVGAHVGLIRFGTPDDGWPEGWQLDVEGAAFPRMDIESHQDMVSTDFRAGVPLTYRRGPWETKFGYYHHCSHLGDEYLISHPEAMATRDNYVRETLIAGIGFRPLPAIRLYGEAGYAVSRDGLTRPWEFQCGAEYSPTGPAGLRGAPFLAVNGHLRQENDFGGNLVVQAGWQWRARTGQLFRTGVQYFNGKSEQRQFVHDWEQQIGWGLWYDF